MDYTVAKVAGGSSWLAAVKKPMRDETLHSVYSAFHRKLYDGILVEDHRHHDKAKLRLLHAICMPSIVPLPVRNCRARRLLGIVVALRLMPLSPHTFPFLLFVGVVDALWLHVALIARVDLVILQRD